MDDSFSVVSYYDFPNQSLIFNENQSIGFAELPLTGESSSFSTLISESNKVAFGDDLDGEKLLADSYIQEVINDLSLEVEENCLVDASGNNGETGGNGLRNEHQIHLTVPEVSLSPYCCTFCKILREIIHVNGKHVRNLEIHGRVGVITHAVLDKFAIDVSSDNHKQQLFDFSKDGTSGAKTFLIQYFEECRQEGYKMLEDPVSDFYRALSIGYNENVNMASNRLLQAQPLASFSQAVDLPTNQQNLSSQQDYGNNGIRHLTSDNQKIPGQHEAESRVSGPSKSFLATQRERTGKMKLQDFLRYFDLPIHEAARRMNVCPTVVKKKCRQGGLSRWPYRKIKGIKRKILKKQEILNTGTDEEKASAADDILILEQELQNIFAKFIH